MEIKDRVLVVEDDKRISNFIKTVLEANNYDVIVAQTGAEAYSMVTSQCPDVVILDLGLPDMDGMKILQGVREWSAMPVIVVSARTMRGIRWRRWISELTITSRSLLEHPSFSQGSAPRSVTQGLGSRISRADRREFLNPAD